MYKNRFSQSIQLRKNFSSRANYTKDDLNDCELMKNKTFLSSWIYESFEELISRLKLRKERQYITRRNRRIDKKE